MGYIRQTALSDAYIADDRDDLTSLPKSKMGSTCLVISENMEYICNSKGKWIARRKTSTDLSPTDYYTKTEIDSKIRESKIALTTNEVLAITMKNL